MAEVESESCPACGKVFEGTALAVDSGKCADCGAMLTREPVTRAWAVVPPAQTPAAVGPVCPNCGMLLEAGDRVEGECKGCSTYLVMDWKGAWRPAATARMPRVSVAGVAFGIMSLLVALLGFRGTPAAVLLHLLIAVALSAVAIACGSIGESQGSRRGQNTSLGKAAWVLGVVSSALIVLQLWVHMTGRGGQ
jgi:hypothetical protein